MTTHTPQFVADHQRLVVLGNYGTHMQHVCKESAHSLLDLKKEVQQYKQKASPKTLSEISKMPQQTCHELYAVLSLLAQEVQRSAGLYA